MPDVDRDRSTINSGNEFNGHQLFPAASHSHCEIGKKLFDGGVDRSRESIMSTAEKNDMEALEILVHDGWDADGRPDHFDAWGPIHFASRHGNLGMVQFLLFKGADPTRQVSMGYGMSLVTPLSLAQHFNHERVAKVLEMAIAGIY
ncbi:hypothetical protein P280DRAFT_163500 [Massarina eburnea CBS 473.64]|uniref:Uncharacterized protein n=1 Tax=Massarina eburnea CBS 473.64 TaxID=1395130 RepID=A0A6A6RL30_9PLEO|nr:hypothetical protein P280DRAFT_163500 [Massarina eburnea CBS 473.64]